MAGRLKPNSKLGRFVVKRRIPPQVLADMSGCSHRYLYLLIRERGNPSLKFVNRVTAACRLLTNQPIRASQLFEIEE
ncbi:MAG: hypothetical protein JO088_16350 [Acidobacteria bacterium]|nr:hypothetical protein [Acidobacteriota bacterium]